MAGETKTPLSSYNRCARLALCTNEQCKKSAGLDDVVCHAHRKSCFSVLSLNMGLMPWPVGMGKLQERSELFVKRLQELEQDPDIVCLQEVFDSTSRNRIASLMTKTAWKYSVVDRRRGAWLLGVNSGLLMFSKYPIERQIIYEFKTYKGPENFARKGVIGAKIRIPAKTGKAVYIFNTHLQAGSGGPIFTILDIWRPASYKLVPDEIEIEELKEAKRLIQQFVYKSPASTREPRRSDAPILLVGDYNISARSDKRWYAQGIHVFQPGLFGLDASDKVKIGKAFSTDNRVDTYWPECSEHDGTVWSERKDEKGKKNMVMEPGHGVDYIWQVNPEADHVITGGSIILDSFGSDVTDHLAVFGRFHFGQVSDRTPSPRDKRTNVYVKHILQPDIREANNKNSGYEYFLSKMVPCSNRPGEGQGRAPGMRGKRLLHKDIANRPLKGKKGDVYVEFSGPGTGGRCMRAGPFSKDYPIGEYVHAVGQWKRVPGDGWFQIVDTSGKILMIT